MTPEPVAELHAHMQHLQAENHALQMELSRVRQREVEATLRFRASMRFGVRLLIPLLDRHRVVRSFGSLFGTVSRFADVREEWPTSDQILTDARTFAECCVRFAVRRRTWLAMFSILAAMIPCIQVWLVVRQNQIIENQTKLSEIQVYDLVARSMTQGDRNARLVTGALLSRADLEFLAGVIGETFDPDLAVLHDREGIQAVKRRMEDAAFRAPLIRAVVRGVEIREDEQTATSLFAAVGPMLERILRDAEERVTMVLRLADESDANDGELTEQVDAYLAQVGDALQVWWLLGKAAGADAQVVAVVERFLHRVVELPLPKERHGPAYRNAIEALLIAVALEPELDRVTVGTVREPDQAVDKGFELLKARIGGDEVDWAAFRKQILEPLG